jgi:hypothetical protein
VALGAPEEAREFTGVPEGAVRKFAVRIGRVHGWGVDVNEIAGERVS